MLEIFITFRSVTRAQRGSKLLDTIGVSHQLLRTPQALAAQGCGYALRLRREAGPAAAEALRQNEIPYQRIYGLDENGNYQEMSL